MVVEERVALKSGVVLQVQNFLNLQYHTTFKSHASIYCVIGDGWRVTLESES
jgi:hypothetical protein